MIKMTIHNGEEVREQKLPCDFLSLRMSLYQMNLMRAPSEVSVRDVEAEFLSTDSLGQKLIGLIRPSDLLSDVDIAAHQLKAAPAPIRDICHAALQCLNALLMPLQYYIYIFHGTPPFSVRLYPYSNRLCGHLLSQKKKQPHPM